MSINNKPLPPEQDPFAPTRKHWLVDAIIDPRSARLDRPLTYLSNCELAPGQAIIVPVGKKDGLAFVLTCQPAPDQTEGVLHRHIIDQIEGISIPPSLFELAKFISEESLCSLSVALGAAIPAGMRDRLATTWTLVTGAAPSKPKKRDFQLRPDSEMKLPPLQAQVLDILEAEGGQIVEKKGHKWEPGTLRTLLTLSKAGLVTRKLTFVELTESRSQDKLWALNPNEAIIETFLRNESKRKPAQALALISIQQSHVNEGRPEFTSSDIKAMAGVTDAVIKSLASQQLLVEITRQESFPQSEPPSPNASQSKAIAAITAAVKKRKFQSFLLFGVTGSGKTEVYLRAASQALHAGRQVLYLVPEIALAAQSIGRIRERFGDRATVLHSDLTATERLNNFHKIRTGKAPIVLGARSALFAPLDNIGLIILDEEHDGAYKQDVEPRYHAKLAAQKLAQIHQCPLVLGSATPSIETFYEAETGKTTFLEMPHRAAEAELPEVKIVDLTEGYRQHHPKIISPALAELLAETLASGDQVILFLNRRAYTPFMLCRDCGRRWTCPRCSVTLSYHKHEKTLKCHHCGHVEIPPEQCPDCGNSRIAPVGLGTEKVEEAVRELHPEVSIARLDRDFTAKKGALEAILASFRSGETQILVGTQMVAKGLDFPGVTLVGVIAADTSINLPDYRSSERAFQLLSQVSGRAGRGKKAGRVVIQTFQPSHPSVLCAQTHEYRSFYEILKAERMASSYPPFVRIVNVVCSGEDKTKVELKSLELAEKLQSFGEVLGPADCAIERIRDRWRRHVFIKIPPSQPIGPLKELVPIYPDKAVSVVFDVDPNSMM